MSSHGTNEVFTSQHNRSFFMLSKASTIISISLLTLIVSSCTPIKVHVEETGYVIGQDNYAFAIYTGDGHLLTHPLEHFRQRQRAQLDKPFTDVYVISHGWNFTIPEAIANYHSYIEIEDQQMQRHSFGSEFRPFFIFVVWNSVTRPLTDATRAILPYELDASLSVVTTTLDRLIFFLPSVWKQSINASTIALGQGYPGRYPARQPAVAPRGDTQHGCRGDDQLSSCYGIEEGTMGSHYPAAALLNDLFHEKYKSPLPLKLHVIGHSYGAKLAALASIEAIRRWELQQSMRGANEIPLESLLLISPAMRPGDLFYVVDVKVFQFLKSALLFLFHPEDVQKEDLAALRPPDIADVEYLLKQIPRKGILYSNYDYPNGLYFDITQFVLNSSEMHRLQADLHSHGQDLESLTPSSQPLNLLYRSIFGVYWHLYKPIALVGGLGTSVGYSSLSWIIAKLINVPSDFVYHVRHNQTFPQTTTGTLKAAGYVFNALHFFMPLDRLLWPGQPADQLGLFRLTRPALGRGGLIKASNGRWLLLNAFPLQNFGASGFPVGRVKG